MRLKVPHLLWLSWVRKRFRLSAPLEQNLLAPWQMDRRLKTPKALRAVTSVLGAQAPQRGREAAPAPAGGVLAEARSIYEATSHRVAVQAFRRWTGCSQRTTPATVACLARDLNKLLAFFGYPLRTDAGFSQRMPWGGRFARLGDGDGP